MKTLVQDLSGNKVHLLEADTSLSFDPFIAYLRQRLEEEKTVKRTLYQLALDEFEKYPLDETKVTLENIPQYELLLEHMYACLSPAQIDQKLIAWGLCFPLQPITFYGTDSLYQLLEYRKENQDDYLAHKTREEFHKERLRMIYAFILKRLYGFQSLVDKDKYHSGIDKETGLLTYYQVHLNTDFIDVKIKGELPALDFRKIHEHLNEGFGYEVLENVLPLERFEFRGISVLSVIDVTAKHAVENINNIRISNAHGEDGGNYDIVIKSLKTLVQNSNIEFDMLPFVRVNDKPVFGYIKGAEGFLFSVWGEQNFSPELFQSYAQAYTEKPNPFFSTDIMNESREEFRFLEYFQNMGIRSLALIPVFHDLKVVGVLGMNTRNEDRFNESALALLEPAITAIAQLFQVYIDEFNIEIEDIIKEKFTSIQPSVQWKFNEVAWHHLHDKKRKLAERTESIHFNEVYPLYGAIDIRNSTIERNSASKADLEYHLQLLSKTLAKLNENHSSSLMEEMIFNSKKWQQALHQESWNTTSENNLNNFLKTEMTDYLHHLSIQNPATKKIIDDYLAHSNAADGKAHSNRYALEVSMQMINNAVNNYFESEKEKIQKPYPCYFEKFRTDGVEYDIYIGQSIAPEKPFNHFHLKNLRLWQLSSMTAIARLTHSLLPGMPVKLQTTQLIFVHNQTIDISFRTDERKFDVEGAYNIRYQMIKKRIDKVLIKDTGERLTQPDRLAIIYFNKRDVEDYIPFIQYLQESGMLHPEMEELDLEDVQGLSGLKALRIGIIQE